MTNTKTNQMAKLPVDVKKPKRRRASSLDARKARSGYLFVLPFILGILLIYFPVIIDSIWFSFNKVAGKPGGTGFTLTFCGLEYYKQALFGDAKFVQTLIVGIKQLLFDVPAIVIFSLFIAVIMNQRMLGRAAFRAIFFIPVILSTGLMDAINQSDVLADSNASGSISTGSGQNTAQGIVSVMDITALFQDMKIGTELVTYVVSLVNDIYNIVNRSGVQMLIFLAGLQSISPAIYEACEIEGASAWETFWKITFPMVSPMIMVNAIYTIIDAFTSQSNQVMNYINTQFSSAQTELATSMAWIYFALVMLIIAAFVGITSAYIFYQKRD